MGKVFKKILLFLLNKIFDRIDLYELMKTYSQDRKSDGLRKSIKYLGEGVMFNGKVKVSNPKYLILGNNVHIGDNAFIKSDGGVVIGDHTHISRNVAIYSVNHDYQGERLPYDNNAIDRPVVIERNVWIGMNVNITPGVRIGEGSIIGMGTTVSKSVPPFSIIGNQSYRVLGQRDEGHYQALDRQGQYGGINGRAVVKERFLANGRELGKKLFFVVRTGRAGSTSIAKVLSNHEKIDCRHEPNPLLIRLSHELASGGKTVDEVKRELADIYVNTGIFDPTKIYGESDQKLGNLITPLAELLPEAKFIWLLRKGENFVASAYSRGWFQEEEFKKYPKKQWLAASHHRKYRFSGHNGQEKNWTQLNAFEKCCFYWRFWNEQIEQQLSALPQDRWMTIKVETLNEDLPAVLQFLGAEEANLTSLQLNTAKQPLQRPNEWDEQQWESFQALCTPALEKWYPS